MENGFREAAAAELDWRLEVQRGDSRCIELRELEEGGKQMDTAHEYSSSQWHGVIPLTRW